MQRYRKPIHKRPFWLPASNYYMLAAAFSLAVFFLIWGLLQDGLEETPYITAGMIASLILGSAVILREVIMRNARNRYLATQRLDRNLRDAAARFGETPDAGKLTLERNAAILREIARKSEAAKVLGRFPEGHREVFQLCEEYLAVAAKELSTIRVGSPRLAALRRGSDIVQGHRRFHLLQWIELEARNLTQVAKSSTRMAERLENAERALSIVDYGLGIYPEEQSLLGSANLLREFVASIKVTNLVGRAERAAFKGDNTRAIAHYRDALFELERGDISRTEERADAAENIKGQIAELLERQPDAENIAVSGEPKVIKKKNK